MTKDELARLTAAGCRPTMRLRWATSWAEAAQLQQAFEDSDGEEAWIPVDYPDDAHMAHREDVIRALTKAAG